MKAEEGPPHPLGYLQAFAQQSLFLCILCFLLWSSGKSTLSGQLCAALGQGSGGGRREGSPMRFLPWEGR